MLEVFMHTLLILQLWIMSMQHGAQCLTFARADPLDTAMDGLEEMWPEELEEQDDEDDEIDLDEYQGVDLRSPVMQDLDRGLHPPNGFLQADITFLFLTGLVASRTARCLLGFTNRGGEDFVIDSIEGSFHFPQDYGFHLQNLSILPLNSVVHPQHEASFSYSFLVAGALGGRQLSLVITLSYHRDQESYKEAVFNKTLMVTESPDEFDGETFFLYVFLGALVILLLIGVHQLLDTRRRRHTPAVMEEQGTGNLSNVNLSWLPPETLKQINKTPPKRSSRKRGLRRGDKSSH